MVRQFGYWRQQAEHGPVFVSHHGRDTHVLLTKADYDHLEEASGRGPENPHLLLAELADRLAQGFILLDGELRIMMINRPACLALNVRREEVTGQPAGDALPDLHESFLYPKIVRALEHGETSAADAPVPARKDMWIHFETFPFDGGVAALDRDISEEVQTHRLADAKAAMIRAMELHGAVGYLRVSARGIINRVDATFAGMLQLPADRLLGVPLIDIVTKHERVAVRDALESVLSEGKPCTFTTNLLANDGSLTEIRAAMIELRGEYASEGAVLVATRH